MPTTHTRSWRNEVSSLTGACARIRFPRPLQILINRLYVTTMQIDLAECEAVESYDSLNALFTRHLTRMRDFDRSDAALIAPTDSRITAQGRLDGEMLLQIKGMPYSVRDLLTEHAGHVSHVIDGNYITFYLSPSDYHRYHAPASLTIEKLIHVPGTLYAVNTASVTSRDTVFIQNERVILECRHASGSMLYVVCVGALNVGNMVFEFEPRVATNSRVRTIQVYEYANLHVEKGRCLGYFNLGSTVVLLAQRDVLESTTDLGQKVRFGDVVARLKSTR